MSAEDEVALRLVASIEDMLPRLKAYCGARRAFATMPGLGGTDELELANLAALSGTLADFVENMGGFDDERDFFNGPVQQGREAFAAYEEKRLGLKN